MCRMAPSWVRFGSLQLPASQEEPDLARQVADHVIKHHFSHLQGELHQMQSGGRSLSHAQSESRPAVACDWVVWHPACVVFCSTCARSLYSCYGTLADSFCSVCKVCSLVLPSLVMSTQPVHMPACGYVIHSPTRWCAQSAITNILKYTKNQIPCLFVTYLFTFRHSHCNALRR